MESRVGLNIKIIKGPFHASSWTSPTHNPGQLASAVSGHASHPRVSRGFRDKHLVPCGACQGKATPGITQALLHGVLPTPTWQELKLPFTDKTGKLRPRKGSYFKEGLHR